MSEWRFSPDEYEEELKQLSGSSAPATIGMLAQVGSTFLKALSEKLKQRDAHVTTMETRIAQHTRDLENRLAALERKALL